MQLAWLERCIPAVAGLAVASCLTATPVVAQEWKGPQTPLDLLAEGQLHQQAAGREKIFFGTDAKPGAYPYQVALIDADKYSEYKGQFCAGTLIDDLRVLTAAHCVTQDNEIKNASQIHVYVGSDNFRMGDRIPVATVFRHPKYEENI